MTETTAIAVREPAGLDRHAFEPQSYEQLMRCAGLLAKSGLVPRAIATPEACATVLLQSRELGLSMLQGIRSIHVIDGKPTLSAQLMHALVLASGAADFFSLRESTAERATWQTRRKGDPGPTSITWTMEQARNAGLDGRGPWKAYPAAMLRARACADLARAVYPDVVGGLYTPDEITSRSTEATIDEIVEGDLVQPASGQESRPAAPLFPPATSPSPSPPQAAPPPLSPAAGSADPNAERAALLVRLEATGVGRPRARALCSEHFGHREPRKLALDDLARLVEIARETVALEAEHAARLPAETVLEQGGEAEPSPPAPDPGIGSFPRPGPATHDPRGRDGLD